MDLNTSRDIDILIDQLFAGAFGLKQARMPRREAMRTPRASKAARRGGFEGADAAKTSQKAFQVFGKILPSGLDEHWHGGVWVVNICGVFRTYSATHCRPAWTFLQPYPSKAHLPRTHQCVSWPCSIISQIQPWYSQLMISLDMLHYRLSAGHEACCIMVVDASQKLSDQMHWLHPSVILLLDFGLCQTLPSNPSLLAVLHNI